MTLSLQIEILKDRCTANTDNNTDIRVGSTPTFLYFDLYLSSAYAAHYVYLTLSRSSGLSDAGKAFVRYIPVTDRRATVTSTTSWPISGSIQ